MIFMLEHRQAKTLLCPEFKVKLHALNAALSVAGYN